MLFWPIKIYDVTPSVVFWRSDTTHSAPRKNTNEKTPAHELPWIARKSARGPAKSLHFTAVSDVSHVPNV